MVAMAVAAFLLLLLPVLAHVEEVERADQRDARHEHRDGAEEPEEDGAGEVERPRAQRPEVAAAVEHVRDVPDGSPAARRRHARARSRGCSTGWTAR